MVADMEEDMELDMVADMEVDKVPTWVGARGGGGYLINMTT